MSDRANGWLLILGGLAIGLVLWLSPSKSAPSSEFEEMTRIVQDRLNQAVLRWNHGIAKTVLTIGTSCGGECQPPCWSAGER